MGARGKKRRRADGSIANGKFSPPATEDSHFELNLDKIEAEFGHDPEMMERVNRIRRERQETH